jgi:uncharacterized protein
MKILITGATGLIGQKLARRLMDEGHSVVALSRSKERGTKLGLETFEWQPERESPPAEALDGVEIVVHLAGEHIAAERWNETQKKRILDSRVRSTKNLVAGMEAMKVRPKAFICASATGFYGDGGERILTENSTAGNDFLSKVCVEWEAAASGAEALGIRVARIRIGIVMALESGALQQMMPVFKLGIGGSLGDGKQWFPWVHVDDTVGIFHHAITNNAVHGAVNAAAPNPVTNAEFTSTLAAALHRPAFFFVPEFALNLALGEMGAMLVASYRVAPQAALASGYQFKYPVLESALSDLLK